MFHQSITAIILAGGQSSRMNGYNKGLQLLNGKPLYQHVVDRIAPQVNDIIISSNQNNDIYQQSAYRVIADNISGFCGPLAGIHSGLMHSQTDLNLVVSCDTPFLPDNLVHRLQKAMGGHDAVYVFDGEKMHPTLLLIHRNQYKSIADHLKSGNRKLLIYLNKINSGYVNFSDKKQSFVNINTLQELSYYSDLTTTDLTTN